MKRKHIILLVIVVVIIAAVITGIVVINHMQADLATLDNVTLTDVDLSAIDDGTYTGSYTSGPVSAEVSVTVADHSITQISLDKHTHGQGASAETIPGDVVTAQSLEIDGVSGATYSSKVILLAIRDALCRALAGS